MTDIYEGSKYPTKQQQQKAYELVTELIQKLRHHGLMSEHYLCEVDLRDDCGLVKSIRISEKTHHEGGNGS